MDKLQNETIKDKNEYIRTLYSFGWTMPDLSNIFNISVERITQIVSYDNKDSRNKTNKQLSTREIQVMDLISEGLRNKEIGYKLKISARTVETHLARILIKLEAINRTNAVYIYHKNN